MDDALWMKVGHAGCNIFGERDSMFPRQRVGRVVQYILESATGHKFRHQVQALLFVQDSDKPEHIVMT